ncbi:hypothetical protein [Methylocucumis oryzae]|uniref:Uncharacterized protein n=1 Tax=Methylocucumis oryzae TaxID=1632867 RepID=A0A0F3IN66_9GAMM|nr:hypothetical protein [Methylocucumis oryzae]KJV08087.1 hypothetical protein VZ94_00575 [Methylocucumis oryzae]
MAKTPNLPSTQRGGFLGLFGTATKKSWEAENIKPASDISLSDAYTYGASTTIASLIGNVKGGVRTRQQIYQDWLNMGQDSICSSSIKLLTTTALGGHDTTGDIVFIEKKPEIQKDQKLSKLVEDIAKAVGPILNEVIYSAAYTGAQYGDAYGRIYANSKGVKHINVDETLHPSLVQPFERGGITAGYAVFIGEKSFERLDISQVARLKMPRIQLIPQYGIIEKSLKIAIAQDDIEQLPLMPSLAGGSLLYPAEDAYNKLNNTLLGLVAQRMNVSLDHRIVGLQMEGMTKEQQDKFGASVVAMFKKVKEVVAESVRTGKPITESIISILPMHAEKQLVNLSQGNTAQQTLNIDDVLVHARLLAGAFGTDLSNLGFLDQVSGWMGDSGLARTSSQAAENSRGIRIGAAEFCHHVIDIHCLKRYGIVFDKSNRPYQVNFYGSISALESERQRTNNDKANAVLVMGQAMQVFKDMGATEEIMENLLSKHFMLDEEDAKLYAKIVNAAPPPMADAGMM